MKDFVQTHRLRPQTNGPIEIFDASWEHQSSNAKQPELAPAVSVYADRTASLSSRNQEVAAKAAKQKSGMYSINSDRPLDSTTVAILRTVDGVPKHGT